MRSFSAPCIPQASDCCFFPQVSHVHSLCIFVLSSIVSCVVL
jgi:hypothetical protein